MAKSINRVELLGTLGADPELRSLTTGASVCNFNIATNESYKDKNSGEWKELTDWHRVVAWDNLAEYANKYLKKGYRVFVEGKLKTRSYEDKDGTTKYITEVLAFNIISLESSSKESSENSDFSNPFENPKQSAKSSVETTKKTKKATKPEIAEEDDDDIPF